MAADEPKTLLDALQASLRAAVKHAPGEVPPAALLWTDADAQWQPLIPPLHSMVPELLVLGDYAPDQRRGPAIWIRCIVEKTLPDVAMPGRTVPVVYMPGISRQTLRAAEECPDILKPMVELQYRGTVWCQRNGRDWTIEAFLLSEDAGLGLDVARDEHTKQALRGALPRLAVTPLPRLRSKRLEAEDFDKLMIEDTPRNLLEWMSDPTGVREQWDQARWSAFRSRCRAEYSFDPEGDGEIVAGERLGTQADAWRPVWDRFVEAPKLYPGITELLRRAKPGGLLFVKETWPDENDDMEKDLRQALRQLQGASAVDARARLGELESQHAERRQWVWAALGRSPLAKAISHLAALAKHTGSAFGGDSVQAMAERYAQAGWLADDALLRALAEVKSREDLDALSVAARSVYLPWMQDSAEHFQRLVAGNPLPTRRDDTQSVASCEPGTCLLFVDALRYDVAQRLVGLAHERKLRVVVGRRLCPVPTVTATTKPAVSPIATQIVGHELGADFAPELEHAGQRLTSERLRKAIALAGYQVLAPMEVGRPQEDDARGWTEIGDFDRRGHDLQAGVAAGIEDLLVSLVDRVESLLSAGWKRVRVVTDHGWLLVPGGLPAMSLPKYLTESRWSRCATLKVTAHVSVPTSSWYWNPSEVFAYGTGVHCFGSGHEYAHGGISLQECLVPDLAFSSGETGAGPTPSIVDVEWVAMRCRVAIEPPHAALVVDIRTRIGDPGSSIASRKQTDQQGKAALLVEDDALIGTAASVVLLDDSGRVVAKKATTVGGEE
ncbi:MAG: BREX-1 system phosphatase PglZ type B [Acidobacteriota bacterium]